ncbi:MAG TPA: hypothetical protein VLL52_23965 [Anaerolineae bacterium]|nr:hypothetical protein [Anaerolineae bacterium]
MPTPFMHLDFAERIRGEAAMPPALGRLLDGAWGAFCLGNVAVDMSAMGEMTREATHFYHVEPSLTAGRLEERPYEVMWRAHPALARAGEMSVGKAVFVAGYCVHLWFDMIWYNEVFRPYFLQGKGWRDLRHLFTVHQVLLTYLDQLALARLGKVTRRALGVAEPKDWLPFASDASLMAWRDMIAEQLLPGRMSKTVEVYAARLKMTPDEFAAHLTSQTWLEQELFGRVPVAEVEKHLAEGVKPALALTADYLNDLYIVEEKVLE